VIQLQREHSDQVLSNQKQLEDGILDAPVSEESILVYQADRFHRGQGIRLKQLPAHHDDIISKHQVV